MVLKAEVSSTPGPAAHRGRFRRWAVLAVAVLAVLAVVIFGGAAWYYAGEIRARALTVHTEQAPVDDLTVLAYSDGQVALRRIGHSWTGDPLYRDVAYGLAWETGSGVVTGAPIPDGDGSVRRMVHVSRGGSPAAGMKAHLSSDVWSDPTAAYGVPYQEVTYPCAGGECPAWLVPGTSTTWMIFVHGAASPRTEELRALGPSLRAGLPSLIISYRNDPGAPVDSSGEYRFGATEWADLEQAVEYATAHGAQHIVLFGASMGGAIVAAFLAHSTVADRISGVVLDAPALDLDSMVDYGAAQTTLPVMGTSLPAPLTATAKWIVSWRDGLKWASVDYLSGNWLHVPSLVFHGTADDTVPISLSDELRAAHPDLVEEIRVPDAGHVESWNIDPDAYQAHELAFLDCVAGTQPAASCR
jgi:pimeloyl-ACP methyl ester carboxylesterase